MTVAKLPRSSSHLDPVHTPTMSSTSDEVHQNLAKELTLLKESVGAFNKTNSIPVGIQSEDAVIYKFFRDRTFEKDEGPIRTIDRAMVRTFQGKSPEEHLTRGQYGVNMIYIYFRHFSKEPRMAETNGLVWLTERIERVRTLINKW